MPLQPSRRDSKSTTSVVRHHQSYLRSLDPGILDGTRATPRPVTPGPSTIVGGSDDGGDDTATSETLFQNTDQFVIDKSGDKVFVLTYIPIQEGATSLQVFWLPLRISASNWTCDDNVLRVSDPGWRADDIVEVAYAYEYDGEDEPSGTIVDFESSGWRWIQVPPAPDSDYSSPTFDDSGWDLASAPFGETTPAHDVADTFTTVDWPDYTTTWEQGTRMWARRTIDADPTLPVVISLRWNRAITVYWNGSPVYSNGSAAGEATFEIDVSLVLTSNSLAIKTVDDAFSGPHTGCYFDAQISQELEEG